MDALLFVRIQFGFVISFHVLFPAFTIGTASWLAFIEWRWLRTKLPVWRECISSGRRSSRVVRHGRGQRIVMAFQFGTNWPRLSDVGRTVIGPLLDLRGADRVLPGSQLLGVMMIRLGPGLAAPAFPVHLHGGAGTLFLHVLDLVVQQLAAYAGRLRDGQRHRASVDWWQVVFNPSFPYPPGRTWRWGRSSSTCFVIGGVGAWYLRKGTHVEAAGAC